MASAPDVQCAEHCLQATHLSRMITCPQPSTRCTDRVQIEDEEHLIKGTILVWVPRHPAYMYGDELEVEGKLETPPVFDDFSYRDCLARRGIHAMVGWPKITLLSRGGGSPVYRALLAVKARIQATIAHILPEPEASLLTGILLGVEPGIRERVKDAFSTSGTMHVVAISGVQLYANCIDWGSASEWLFDMSTNESWRGVSGNGRGANGGDISV
jgi:hypothetical protein